jgi:hypothetical protein
MLCGQGLARNYWHRVFVAVIYTTGGIEREPDDRQGGPWEGGESAGIVLFDLDATRQSVERNSEAEYFRALSRCSRFASLSTRHSATIAYARIAPLTARFTHRSPFRESRCRSIHAARGFAARRSATLRQLSSRCSRLTMFTVCFLRDSRCRSSHAHHRIYIRRQVISVRHGTDAYGADPRGSPRRG